MPDATQLFNVLRLVSDTAALRGNVRVRPQEIQFQKCAGQKLKCETHSKP
jgi:hypothetical protein